MTVDISDNKFTAKGKPVEIKESNIPFKNAPEWANFYVRTLQGNIMFFEDQPSIEMMHFYCNTGRQLEIEDTTRDYNPGYRQSIRRRPQRKNDVTRTKTMD